MSQPSAVATDPGILADRYIVTLRPGVSTDDVLQAHQLRPRFVYQHAIKGFASTLPPGVVARLRNDPRVARIDPDQVVQTGQTVPEGTWGLDRIDQRYQPLDRLYGYSANGTGVTAYIIDTGIRYTHAEFGGRARFGFDAYGGDGSDCHRHGTHVAGIVGGALYGVAKNVDLVSVKVADCTGSGTVSAMIAGINWIIANRTLPPVANISMYSAPNAAGDDAVRNLIASGVTTAVLAGNGNTDASTISPARVAEAITVGAVDSTDTRASFSNYGSAVDWFAPGVSIESASFVDDTSSRLMTGTSMATPFTTGVAALYAQQHPSESPAQVRDALFSFTTKNVVASALSANRHLLINFEDVMIAPQLQPPTVTVTSPLNGAQVLKNSNLTIQASASDSDGVVTGVAFYVNNQLLGTDSAAPYTWVFKTSAKRNVAYTIHAVATDDTALVTTSAPVGVVTK